MMHCAISWDAVINMMRFLLSRSWVDGDVSGEHSFLLSHVNGREEAHGHPGQINTQRSSKQHSSSQFSASSKT